MMHYRELEESDLTGLPGIDRSDYSPSWCRIEKGVLVQEDRDFVHTGFDRDAWEEIAGEYAVALRNDTAILIGAYDGDSLVGIAGLDTSRTYGPSGNMYNFGPMWVSREYRGGGIGRKLFSLMVEKASTLPVDGLYVSATPVPGTVGFYMSMGCRLLDSPDPELFSLEPEDIHMFYDLVQFRESVSRKDM